MGLLYPALKRWSKNPMGKPRERGSFGSKHLCSRFGVRPSILCLVQKEIRNAPKGFRWRSSW